MTKTLSVLFILIWTALSLAGQTFNNRYYFEGYSFGVGFAVEQWSDSYYIFSTIGDTLYKTGVHALDQEGNVIQDNSVFFDNTGLFAGYSNTSDFNSNLIVSAGSLALGSGRSNGIVIKWNNQCDTIASVQILPNDSDSLILLYQAKLLPDGICAIGSVGDNVSTERVLLVKLDFDLNEIWRKEYGTSSIPHTGFSIVPTSDGGFLLGGVRKIGESWDHCVIKTDDEGNQQYLKYHGNDYYSHYAHVENTSDGKYIFGGMRQTGENDFQSMICKLDNDLDTLWCKTYNDPGPDCFVNSIKLLPDGNFIACGVDRSNFTMYGYILKIDPDGNTIWYRKYTQTEDNWCFFYDVIQTSDGGYFLTGSLSPDSDLGLNQDIWGLKLDDMGCLVPGCDTLISVGEQSLSAGFSVYPNPTSQFINIYLPQGSLSKEISFELLDISGKVVKSFTPKMEDATFMMDIEELASGIYFLRENVEGDVVHTEKIVKQ
jgi:Secretion system C-terminal sorting domain